MPYVLLLLRSKYIHTYLIEMLFIQVAVDPLVIRGLARVLAPALMSTHQQIVQIELVIVVRLIVGVACGPRLAFVVAVQHCVCHRRLQRVQHPLIIYSK